MAEIKLGGSISLVGFNSLEPVELIVVKKLVGNFVRKLGNHADYKSLRLELRMHKKGKTFLHEINANTVVGDNHLGTNVNDYNLYACINKVAEKIISEVSHIQRSTKEVGQEMKRQQKKSKIKEKILESKEI